MPAEAELARDRYLMAFNYKSKSLAVKLPFRKLHGVTAFPFNPNTVSLLAQDTGFGLFFDFYLGPLRVPDPVWCVNN